MIELSFDQIDIPHGELRGRYSPEEFIELPVIKRVKELMAKNVVFLKGNTEVDRINSLNELRSWTTTIKASL